MRTFTTSTAAAALLLGIASTASANIVFDPGNHPQANEENILFTGGETGLVLTDGQVDHTGAGVNFTTLGSPLQVLRQDSGGQAQIFCLLNCTDNSAIGGPNMDQQLSSISMRAGLLNGQATAWTDAIINLENGLGTALVTVTDNFGAPFTYVLGNGQNFLTMIAEPGSGEFITRIDVTNAITGDPFGFDQFKQPRVSGLCILGDTGCATVNVPEPGSLALLSIGALGTLYTVRRRKTITNTARIA
jgi:hypothetical protein